MSLKRARTRLWAIAAAFAVIGVAACQQDDLIGPSTQFGDPLLDINLGPASNAVFPSGTAYIKDTLAAAPKDTLVVQLTNLLPLPAGSNYEVFLVDSLTADSTGVNNMMPAIFRSQIDTRTRRPVNRDSSVVTTASVVQAVDTLFTVSDTNQTVTLTITTALVGRKPSLFSHAVVAIVPSFVAAKHLGPYERTGMMWLPVANQNNTITRTDDVLRKFGTPGIGVFGDFAVRNVTDRNVFNGAVLNRRRLPFVQTGTFYGAIRGGQMRLNFRNIARPPLGTEYSAWLIDDRTGTTVRIGKLLHPVPDDAEFVDADSVEGPLVSEQGILEGQVRADTATLGNIKFDDFTRVVLLVEAKGASDKPTSAIAIAGSIPTSVATRHASPGKLFGQVTSTSSAPVKNTTVYLTGQGRAAPLLVTTADSTGAYKFRSVNVGSYRIHVIPPGGTVQSDSADVTIGQHADPAGGFAGDSVTAPTLHIP